MKVNQGIIISGLLMIVAVHSHAIEDLKIQVQGSDVVLDWPSTAGETYIIQHRATLDEGVPWVTLSASHPAAANASRTTFTHAGIVQFCGGGSSSLLAATSGEGLLALSLEGTEEPVIAPLPLLVPWWNRWMHEGRKPNVWEAEKRPPFPWEAQAWNAAMSAPSGLSAFSLGGESLLSSSSSCPPDTGFYRVVRKGVHLVNLSNGAALSGIVQLTVEAGNDAGTLTSLTISANDSAIEGTPMLSMPFGHPLSFTVDTRRLDNGTYTFRSTGLWSTDSTNEFDLGYVQLSGPETTVTVNNAISYPQWIQDYRSDLLLMRVKSTTADVDWEIDVYGEAQDYIGTFSGHSQDGLIQFAWDLQGPNGTFRTDRRFYTMTTIFPPGLNGASPLSQLNPPLIKVVDNYPAQGKWIVARASYIPTTYDNYDIYKDTINAFAQMGESEGGVVPEPGYYRNFGEALLLSRQSGLTNWTVFLNSFTNRNVRNFYFDGHGGPDFIGYGYGPDGSPKKVSASAIAREIGNVNGGTNTTRYRWVWIDACSTAYGAWPETFGMGNRENVPLSDYTSRPAAFCGFTKPVYGFNNALGEIAIDSINYRSFFLLYWTAFEMPLKASFEEARISSGFVDANFLKVYGYWDMHWYEFNTAGEWQ